MQYTPLCLHFKTNDLIMNKIIDNINPELVKLQGALQKALSDIKKQSYTDRLFLLLFFSITLLKDRLLKDFRNIIVHSTGEFDTKNIKGQSNAKRLSIYATILDKLKTIGINQQEVIWTYNYVESVDPSKINNDEYKNVFENLLIQLYEIGKREYPVTLLPKEVVDCIYLLDNREEKSVYNPFSGFGDLSFHSSIKYYYGEEKNAYQYTLHLLRILIHDSEEKIIITNNNSIHKNEDITNKYDLVVSMPPIKRILKRSPWDEILSNNNNNLNEYYTHEQTFFKNAFKKINAQGKIIAIIAQSFLNEQGISKKIVRSWIDEDRLETIIALPNLKRQFNTSAQLYIVLLSNQKNPLSQIRYVDARSIYLENEFRINKLNVEVLKNHLEGYSESQTIKFLNKNILIENEYDLCVDKFFYKKYEGKELREICNEIRNRNFAVPGEMGRLVKISNLKNDKHDYVISSNDVELLEINSTNWIKISESCLLIASIGNKIKPTYFNYSDEPIYIFPNIMAFRVDKSLVNINYLINELHQEYISEQLSNISTGTVIPFYRKESFLSIIIDVDKTLSEQKKLIDKFDYSIISDQASFDDAKNHFADLKKQFVDDVKTKEHNILQFLSASQSATLLIEYLVSNEEQISSESKEKFYRQINSLKKSLTSASYNIRRLSEKIDYDVKENIDINLLIKEAIIQGIDNSSEFKIDYTFHKDSFYLPLEKGVDPIYIDPISFISRNDFFILYNNLLENAVKHGFTDKYKNYQFKIDLYCIRENIFSDSMTIIFSNNGKPFPKGMSESYCVRGEKAGESANEGIGTWKVCQIVKEHFKGELKVIDNQLDEYPVKIEIKLPIVGWGDEK